MRTARGWVVMVAALAGGCSANQAEVAGELEADVGLPVVAVFGVEARGVDIGSKDLESLSSYLSTSIAAGGAFRVVPPEDLRLRMRRKKIRAEGDWYAKSVQLEIGREVAASKALVVKVLKIGSVCPVTADLYDLRTSTSDGSRKVDSGCGLDDVRASLDKVASAFAPPRARPRQPASGPVGRGASPMVALAGGSFQLGSTAGEADEGPVRAVRVSPFRIDKYEVTVSQYRACVAQQGCRPARDGPRCNYAKPDRGEHPINCLSWEQAQDFCRWSGKRLCTEAEWEFAAQGPIGRKYPWGDEPPSCERAVMNEGDATDLAAWGCGTGATLPVGSKVLGATPEGLMDMSGNVWEWVWDAYQADAYGRLPKIDPAFGDSWSRRRVRRGAGMGSRGPRTRVNNRGSGWETGGNSNTGIRCCSDPV